LATVVGQIVGVLTALLFLLAVRDSGWSWAAHVGAELDVGFSAGALAAAAVASAALRPPWRLRARLVLGLYVVVAALYIGDLADLSRLVAVGVALCAGPRLTRGLGPRVLARPSRREWRLLTVGLLLLIAASTVISYLVPSDGPLGPTADRELSWIDVAITVVAAALLVNGLRTGRLVIWRWAVSLSALSALAGVLTAVLAPLRSASTCPTRWTGRRCSSPTGCCGSRCSCCWSWAAAPTGCPRREADDEGRSAPPTATPPPSY